MVKNLSFWIGIIILSFSLLMFFSSLSLQYYGEYGPGPGLFPLWISGILALLTIIYIINSFKKENMVSFSDAIPSWKIMKRVLTVIASIIIFILVSPFVGYIIAGILTTVMLLVSEYKWYTSLGIAASITFALFFIFKIVLEIPLPANILGW